MKKRILGMLLVLTLLTGLLAGCNKAGSSNPTTPSGAGTGEAGGEVNFDEEPYEINFLYVVAQEGTNIDKVRAEVNELTLRELNMTVNLIPMTFGVYMQQVSMMLAANEPLDLFPAFPSNFATYIEAQYILNAADYLDYMPDAVKVLGDDAYAGYVGDFLTGFGLMKERGYVSGLIIRKDLFDGLDISLDDFDMNVDDLSSYDQLLDLFAAAKEAYPDMTMFDGANIMGQHAGAFTDGLGDNFGVLMDYGQSTEFVNWFETDLFYRLCEVGKAMYDRGYSSADIAVNKDSGELKMLGGNTFAFTAYIKPNTDVEKLAQTGYEVVTIPLSENMKTTSNAINPVYAIANASKDPVKAATFMNWMYTSREFNDLINWGVEGEDWIETADGFAAYPDGVDASNVGYHQDYGWMYPNQFAGHPWVGNPTDIWEQYSVYNGTAIVSKAFGFNFDSTPVANEMAQLNAVQEQYMNDLAFGVLDLDTGLAAFNDALYNAGLQTVIDEKQRQLDEWLAAQ